MGVYHGFEKNETATMFFLKKPFLVNLNKGQNRLIFETDFCVLSLQYFNTF